MRLIDTYTMAFVCRHVQQVTTHLLLANVLNAVTLDVRTVHPKTNAQHACIHIFRLALTAPNAKPATFIKHQLALAFSVTKTVRLVPLVPQTALAALLNSTCS